MATDSIYPTDEACAELFKWFGWAVFEAAGLEEALVLLIAIDSCPSPSGRGSPALRELIDHRRTQTFGSLLKEVKASLGLPDPLVDEFNAALVERNRLIHNFHRDCLPEMVNEWRRRELFRKLREAKNRFATLHEKAMDEINHRLRDRGFSPDDIRERTEALLGSIRNETSPNDTRG